MENQETKNLGSQAKGSSAQLFDGPEVCSICGGKGWYWIAAEFPTISWCPVCRKKQLSKLHTEKGGLTELVRKYSFENFSPLPTKPWQEALKKQAEKYLSVLLEAKENFPWFFLSGNAGGGKTHICGAICHALVDAGRNVKYMVWPNEVHALKAYVADPCFDAMISPFKEADILFIDDLFKGTGRNEPNPTDADLRLCFEILNYRYSTDKATIISSEYYLTSELLPLDQGVFSRVFEMTGKEFNIAIKRSLANNYRLKDAGITL